MMKILGIGEIVWDCLPGCRKLGGAPVNFAFYAQELGAESFPVSAVGADALGDETIEACRTYGLQTGYIQRNGLPTSRVLVTVDGAGVPQYEIVENVAWDALEASSDSLALAAQADCICWGSLAQRSEAARNAIAQILDAAPQNCLKVFDINIRQHYYSSEIVTESLRKADILKLNEEEMPLVLDMTGCSSIDEVISRFGIKYVIHTCGAAFSEVYSPDGLVSHIPTPKGNYIDTIGAGDSFTAAFVTTLLAGGDVKKCHLKAVEVAAYVCTCNGAINPLPKEISA